MGRCEECAHWVDPEEWDVRQAGMGRCDRIRHENPHQLLGVGWVMHDDTEKLALRTRNAAEAMAIVVDGSGYRADFYCRPDFGCVLWKSVEQSK